MSKNKNTLLLASASQSRQRLLTEARIPFKVIEHQCDERAVQQPGTVEEIVQHLAFCKASMAVLPTAVLPPVAVDEPVFVLAADTFISDSQGNLYGKQSTYDAAVATLRTLNREGARVTSGFCCQRRVNNQVVEQIAGAVGSRVELDLSDAHIATYLAGRPDFMHIAGALAVEEFGAQFVRAIHGSYTAVLGLPMVEVREALEQLGFFE